ERAHLDVLDGVPDAALIDAIGQAGYDASLPRASENEQATIQRRLRRERLAVAAALLLASPLVLPMLVQPLGLHWMLPA
ncbi:hypothetical protein ABTK82_20715, partial [Acinetobacter baumannii]